MPEEVIRAIMSRGYSREDAERIIAARGQNKNFHTHGRSNHTHAGVDSHLHGNRSDRSQISQFYQPGHYDDPSHDRK